MASGITLNSRTWWVIRTRQACKLTSSSRSGWHHLIMAVVRSIAWIILSQVSLKWCSLTSSHLRGMTSNKISRLSSRVSRYHTDSPNSVPSSPNLLNSQEACLLPPLTFRCLHTTPCQPSKWCFFSSSNLLSLRIQVLLRLTQLQSPTSCISNQRSSIILLSLKMETLLFKRRSTHSKTRVLGIARKTSWDLLTSPRRLRSPDSWARKITRQPLCSLLRNLKCLVVSLVLKRLWWRRTRPVQLGLVVLWAKTSVKEEAITSLAWWILQTL